jgi:predicted transcriptional regulator
LHGLKASIETKGDYAYWLHITYPELEQNEIARRIGITQGAVSKAIARRDKEAREAMDQEETLDEEEQKKQLKKTCRRFTRVATHFLNEVQQLDDTELSEVFNTIMKKEERVKLARIGRLLMNEDALSVWYRSK